MAGRLTFSARARRKSAQFDLVLDMRRADATPTFLQHALPQGYLRSDGRDLPTVLKLRELVGEFEAQVFEYKQSSAPTAANATVGCSACVDICSAEAIPAATRPASAWWSTPTCAWAAAPAPRCAHGRDDLCLSACGDQGQRFKTLLSTYAAARQGAVLLLHSQGVAGVGSCMRLGRAWLRWPRACLRM